MGADTQKEQILRMMERGKILGLPLLDHIIIGAEGRFLSLAEMEVLNQRLDIG